ncbi:hypothetical protein Bhyg_02818 [Pseudolycoriella hygida]|uniref:Uncharacterized protein n=1 Tax=Pseudolycoriella hygida TaxID=35572 RepID=A0A9Q0NC50_9DIPT|nr:hypothetical protein Bhyg_02818 [Pseudolycoriella hygida]
MKYNSLISAPIYYIVLQDINTHINNKRSHHKAITCYNPKKAFEQLANHKSCIEISGNQLRCSKVRQGGMWGDETKLNNFCKRQMTTGTYTYPLMYLYTNAGNWISKHNTYDKIRINLKLSDLIRTSRTVKQVIVFLIKKTKFIKYYAKLSTTIANRINNKNRISIGRTVTICQLNIEGSSQEKSEFLSKLADENEVHVIAIQETHIGDGTEYHTRGLVPGFTVAAYINSRVYGVATYIREDFTDYNLLQNVVKQDSHLVEWLLTFHCLAQCTDLTDVFKLIINILATAASTKRNDKPSALTRRIDEQNGLTKTKSRNFQTNLYDQLTQAITISSMLQSFFFAKKVNLTLNKAFDWESNSPSRRGQNSMEAGLGNPQTVIETDPASRKTDLACQYI